MKIGVFDSGFGGLILTRAIRDAMPDYDLIYLGDTLHVPYGGRSQEAIIEYSRRAIDFFFENDCVLVVIACNAASASALRWLQQVYLPKTEPDRRILGVIVPTLEAAIDGKYKRIGLMATSHLVRTKMYDAELFKLDDEIKLYSNACPLLVPMIEENGLKWVKPILSDYLEPLLEENIEALILGCTHYPFLKAQIKELIPEGIDILSQDEIIPVKLKNYLQRHPEIEKKLAKTSKTRFCVTDSVEAYHEKASCLFGGEIRLEKVDLHSGTL